MSPGCTALSSTSASADRRREKSNQPGQKNRCAKGTTKAPTRKLSRLNSMASGLTAYVSRIGFPPTRKTGFQVWSSSPGRAFTRRAPIKGFQLTSLFVVLPFQASWHNHLNLVYFSSPAQSPILRTVAAPTLSLVPRYLHLLQCQPN